MPSTRGDALAGVAAPDYVYLGDIAGTIAAAVPIAGVRVRRTTQQTLTNDAETPISFDTEDFDVGNFWVAGSPTVFTVPAGMGGLYSIAGHVSYLANATGVRFATIEADTGAGFAVISRVCLTNSGPSFTCIPCCAVAQLAPGNQVRMLGRQNTGGNLDTAILTGMPIFGMVLCSPHT